MEKQNEVAILQPNNLASNFKSLHVLAEVVAVVGVVYYFYNKNKACMEAIGALHDRIEALSRDCEKNTAEQKQINRQQQLLIEDLYKKVNERQTCPIPQQSVPKRKEKVVPIPSPPPPALDL